MRALIPALLVGSLVFAVLIYIGSQHPDIVESIKISTHDNDAPKATAERSREDRINALLISSKNKLDLMNGRPFWGAAPHMIELAFNDDPDGTTISVYQGTTYQFQMYGFGGVRSPIILEFQNSKLACVHYPGNKSSACDTTARSYYTDPRTQRINYPFR